MEKLKTNLLAWLEKNNAKFETILEEKGYSEKKKKHIREINDIVWSRIGFAIIFFTTYSLINGTEGIFFGILTFFVIIILDILLKNTFDNWILAAGCFLFMFLSLNMFFDNWGKTLAFPLAYLFYRAGKAFCPDFIQGLFSVFEKHIPKVGLLNAAVQDAQEYVKNRGNEEHSIIRQPRMKRARKPKPKYASKHNIHIAGARRRNKL